MHLDNSACNLASLNLRKFEHGGEFDVVSFRRAVEIIFTAQEILVSNSSYPTAAIGVNAKAYRQLGLGYANLGGLLMSLGIPYDSDEGRAWAATITALMTGQAYRTSVELTKVQGPFDGYEADREGMLRVLRKRHTRCPQRTGQCVGAHRVSGRRVARADGARTGPPAVARRSSGTAMAGSGRPGRDGRGPEDGDAVLRQRRGVGRNRRDQPRVPHPGHGAAPHQGRHTRR
jgi:ribonucleoside-diphosphate reductase alpha chain